MGNVVQKSHMEFLIDKADFVQNNIDKSSFFTLTGVAVGSYVIIKIGSSAYRKLQLNKKRGRKRAECLQQIHDLETSLASVEYEKVVLISKLSTEELLTAMRNGDYTCQEVLHAFQCKALEAHKKTNCLVQPILEAEETASRLTSADKSKPLYGLPVSIKDNFGVKDYDCTIGASNWIDHPFPEDCVLVQVIKHQGGIPFVKTNVPQGMLSWDSCNPIYGKTTHPLDPKRGVGGSSGGEAALIAAGGSLMGLGGDIGGSIRIPAALCGVVGLKPTAKRLSPVGTHPFGKGQFSCASSFGPMGKDVDSVALLLRSLCVPKMWELDPKIPPIPFNEEVFSDKRRLTIGYYTIDAFMEITPAMKRGVLEAKTLLQQMGHTVVEWNFPAALFNEIVLLWPQLVFGDGGKEMINLLKNDAVDASSAQLKTLLSLPVFVKKILGYILWPLMPNISKMLTYTCGNRSVFDSWQVNRKQLDLTQQVINLWLNCKFDAVLAPGFTCPAMPSGTAQHASGAVSCTSVYNVLDFVAGSLPVTTVTAQDETENKNYPTKDIWHYAIKKGLPDSTGLPVNVQVVCLPWHEEMCLRVMKELETAVEKKQQAGQK